MFSQQHHTCVCIIWACHLFIMETDGVTDLLTVMSLLRISAETSLARTASRFDRPVKMLFAGVCVASRVSVDCGRERTRPPASCLPCQPPAMTGHSASDFPFSLSTNCCSHQWHNLGLLKKIVLPAYFKARCTCSVLSSAAPRPSRSYNLWGVTQ